MLLKYGERVIDYREKLPTDFLFKKCAKATFDAFLTICHKSHAKGMSTVKGLLQLAFKKFALEYDAVRGVTEVDREEYHPMKLYQGVIRKYDARLYHEWKRFDQMRDDEREYCKKFFADYKFTDEQIEAVIDYKDAYSLKEVVSYLLYIPDYFIAGFEFTDVFSEK